MIERERPLVWALVLFVVAAAHAGTAAAQMPPQLAAQLEGALATYGRADASWVIVVLSLDTGDTLFELNPDVPLAPASNMKLLTTAAALARLGPDYRFRTYLVTDGEVRDSILHGDLVLFGTGDPGISDRFYRRKDDVLQSLIDQLQAAGVRHVEGDVVADASFFPGPLRHDGWDRRDLNEHFTAGISALSYNENVVSFRIVPGPMGEPPVVSTVPSPSGLEVQNLATTVSTGPRPRLAILRDDPLEPVRIEGRMLANSRDVWRQMTVSDPALFAGAVFRDALERRGITVTGRTRVVHLPAGSAVRRVSAPALGRGGATILARHVSEPLTRYLEVVNKESNNLFAEVLFRAVGRAATGVGSFDRSAVAVKEALAELGVDTTGLAQVDGSGLAGGNRVTPRAFVETLERVADSPFWPDFWETLPRAGTPREMSRMSRTAAAGNLRAKTGTIERVSALSGVVRSADGERLAFSILVNDARSQSRAKRVENLIGIRLASFTRRSSDIPVMVAAAPVPEDVLRRDRHQIIRGENLSVIAQRYGVSVDEIVRLNPRIEPDRLMPGEWIAIPQRNASR